MTNKTTPDDDWLRSLLADYKIGFVVGDKDVEQHLSAFVAAINAKIMELLVEELNGVTEQYSNIYGLEVARLGLSKEEPFTVFHRIISDRIQELQASQPINKEIK
jgi:hypothetical protein